MTMTYKETDSTLITMMQEQTIKISARRKMIGINFEDRIESNVGGKIVGKKDRAETSRSLQGKLITTST